MTWVMWNLVSIRLEIVLVLVQDSCTVCARRTIGSKMFWTHTALLLGNEGQVEYLVSVRLDIVLILTQDRCAVCAERTIGSEIILDAPDGTSR